MGGKSKEVNTVISEQGWGRFWAKGVKVEFEKESVWEAFCQLSVFTVGQVDNIWLIFLSLPKNCQLLHEALEHDCCGQGNCISYNMQVFLTRPTYMNHPVGSKCHYIIYILEICRTSQYCLGVWYNWGGNFIFMKFFLSLISEYSLILTSGEIFSFRHTKIFQIYNYFYIWAH